MKSLITVFFHPTPHITLIMFVWKGFTLPIALPQPLKSRSSLLVVCHTKCLAKFRWRIYLIVHHRSVVS